MIPYQVYYQLVTAQSRYPIDVVGPPLASDSHQSQSGHGDGLKACALAWAAEQARCPPGHLPVNGRPGHDVSGDVVIRSRFDRGTCRACKARGPGGKPYVARGTSL